MHEHGGRIGDAVIGYLADAESVRQMLHGAGVLKERETMRVERAQLTVHVVADRARRVTADLQRVGLAARQPSAATTAAINDCFMLILQDVTVGRASRPPGKRIERAGDGCGQPQEPSLPIDATPRSSSHGALPKPA